MGKIFHNFYSTLNSAARNVKKEKKVGFVLAFFSIFANLSFSTVENWSDRFPLKTRSN